MPKINLENFSRNKNIMMKSWKIPKRLVFGSISFEIEKMIGRGGYAKVFLAKKNSNLNPTTDGDRLDEDKTIGSRSRGFDESFVAIKIVRPNFSKESSNDLKATEREALIMIRLAEPSQHENLVSLINYFEYANYFCFVLEYCCNKSLGQLLRNDCVTLTSGHVRNFLQQICFGLSHLHQNLIVHRDLKLDNILLDERFTAKICDFGLAISLSHPNRKLYKICGTLKYQAPEMIEKKGYGLAVDVWALGCITYRMFYGRSPFDGKSSLEILNATRQGTFRCFRQNKYSSLMTNQEIHVIRSMLVKHVDERIRIDELLEKNQKFFSRAQPFNRENYIIDKPVSINNEENNLLLKQKKFNRMLEKLEKLNKIIPEIKQQLPNFNNQSIHNCLVNTKLVPQFWIHQWIDLEGFGFGYNLGQKVFGFNFEDSTKILTLIIERNKINIKTIFYCDKRLNKELPKVSRFEQIEQDSNQPNFSESISLPSPPQWLGKKLKIIEQARLVLRKKNRSAISLVSHKGEDNDDIDNDESVKQLTEKNLPWLIRWREVVTVWLFQLDTNLIQIDFGSNQTKLLLDFESNSPKMLVFVLTKKNPDLVIKNQPTNNNNKNDQTAGPKLIVATELQWLFDKPKLITKQIAQYIGESLKYILLLKNVKRELKMFQAHFNNLTSNQLKLK